MKGRRHLTIRLAAMLALAVAAPAVVSAHDVLYPGTVLSVQAARIRVQTVDPDTRKERKIWFAVTKDTKVKRAEARTTYTDAKIVKDERIVVVVDHDAETGNVATELRLAAR